MSNSRKPHSLIDWIVDTCVWPSTCQWAESSCRANSFQTRLFLWFVEYPFCCVVGRNPGCSVTVKQDSCRITRSPSRSWCCPGVNSMISRQRFPKKKKKGVNLAFPTKSFGPLLICSSMISFLKLKTRVCAYLAWNWQRQFPFASSQNDNSRLLKAEFMGIMLTGSNGLRRCKLSVARYDSCWKGFGRSLAHVLK